MSVTDLQIAAEDINRFGLNAEYVGAYEQLSRLFSFFGVMFSFVETDVTEKREILKALHGNDSENYATVGRMVAYECCEKDAPPKNQGSRTLLRLHRALQFVIFFVEDLRNASESQGITEIFRSCYDRTLAEHHGWFIRKGVQLASHTIPSRPKLMEEIFDTDDHPKEEVDRTADQFVKAATTVYNRVQKIYRERDLLDLP
ncbi:Glycolipid transfer protein domain containing protein [Aphelenchoides avenae]|nr:Glycolipid transfer protein domain containing protein [Aphelenchus avenae]